MGISLRRWSRSGRAEGGLPLPGSRIARAALVAVFLFAHSRPAGGEDPAPAPRPPESPWRDAKAVERFFAEACEAVERSCGATFARRPSVRLSRLDDVRALEVREHSARLADMGFGTPRAWRSGFPAWLVRLDAEANVVHVLPELAEDVASEPKLGVLATETGLRLLLVGTLVDALDGQRFPVTPADREPADARFARSVVRQAHAHAVMAAVAADWGVSEDLGNVRRALLGEEPTFTMAAGVAFLDAVRAERGVAGLDAVLREPPTSSRLIERPELFLHPEKVRESVDLDALLLPMRALVRDPLWHVTVMRPSDAAFRRSMRSWRGRRLSWGPSEALSLDARLLEASDVPDFFPESAWVRAWVVSFADAEAARSFVDSWDAARTASGDSAGRVTKGAGLDSKLHGLVLENGAGSEVPLMRQVAAVGRVVFVLDSIAAPEIDRAAIDGALGRMAAFLADPVKARAEWAQSPAPFIAHGRSVTVEVEGPDGQRVPRATVEIRPVHGPRQRFEVRAGKDAFVLPFRVRAYLWLWGAQDENGAPLPFAPVEKFEVEPEATDLRVPLVAGSVVHGEVSDYDAKPAAGVVVVAVRDAERTDVPLADLDVVYGKATSGPDGRFRIVGVGDGPYRLLAYEGAAEKPVAQDEFVTPRDPSHLEVPRGMGPIVTVVDSAGRPVVGARVVVRSRDMGLGGDAAVRVDSLTGADGRVRAFLPRHETFALEVTPPAGSDLDEPDPDHEWRPAPLVLRLADGAPIRGVVVDASGTPVRGVVFRRTGSGLVRFYTGNDGRFRLRGVGVGSVRLLALAGGGAYEPPAEAAPDAWTEVAPGARQGVVIRTWTPPAASPK